MFKSIINNYKQTYRSKITMKKYNLSLFIFRRDLRLEDNIGLIKALEQSNIVMPCFIFNREQIDKKNQYRSLSAIQFMIESLIDLDKDLNRKSGKLYLFYGNNLEIIQKIINKIKIDAIFLNKDYTPYSRERDKKISDLCNENSIDFNDYDDALINDPKSIKNKKGQNYAIFSSFYKACLKLKIDLPLKNNYKNFYNKPIDFSYDKEIYKTFIKNPQRLHQKGGRLYGKKIINNIDKFQDYGEMKDYLFYNTTWLSAHNKFGTVSSREVYHKIKDKLKDNKVLIRQLYWRDFFTYIALYKPEVFHKTYKDNFNNIKWLNNIDMFNLWCKGQTGFPIVDAAMRQLNKTGYMPNRARLIVASFLVKDLHINWQWGEKYFAQKLIDYDPSVNNGNWQWVASTGVDSQPYFRIFNPWLQQKKFDSECIYIKKWVPELNNIEPKVIHAWYKQNDYYDYLKPIIEHAKEARDSIRLYQNSVKNN